LSTRLKRIVEVLLALALGVAMAAMVIGEAEAQNASSPKGHPSGTSAAQNPTSIVVTPGASLWSISRERLGPNATPQQIYNEAARIYALNSERIGEDPNLIYPGEVLLLEPAREPVDAPAVAGRLGRGARPALSERATRKVAAPEPSREAAQRTSRDVPRDLAREPSDAPPTHQPSELARPPIPKSVAEPAPKAASDEERWLPQGRLLLAALVGTATVWGAVCLPLVVAALVAWKLPMRRITRFEAQRWEMPRDYGTQDHRASAGPAPSPASHAGAGERPGERRERRRTVEVHTPKRRRAGPARAPNGRPSPNGGLALGAHDGTVRRAVLRARTPMRARQARAATSGAAKRSGPRLRSGPRSRPNQRGAQQR
jgi:hypothetical protein